MVKRLKIQREPVSTAQQLSATTKPFALECFTMLAKCNSLKPFLIRTATSPAYHHLQPRTFEGHNKFQPHHANQCRTSNQEKSDGRAEMWRDI
jgi:hypothetical protein